MLFALSESTVEDPDFPLLLSALSNPVIVMRIIVRVV
jgi:hypothetical protein